ncbi:hypothetical protein ACOSQ3_029440 [Xanthoceras sorbifolium]
MKNPLILIDSNSTASPFTAEQVQQLIALLKPQAMANQVGSSSFTANLSAISLSSSLSHNIDWIIDSGATDHIVSSVSFLSSITSNCSTIKLPDDCLAHVSHILVLLC